MAPLLFVGTLYIEGRHTMGAQNQDRDFQSPPFAGCRLGFRTGILILGFG